MASQQEDRLAGRESGGRERVLAFRLGEDAYAIRIAEIGGVLSCAPIRALPGSPPCVIGLCEWRGSVLTVLDLAGLLDCEAPGDPACLIRLGSPMDQTALHLSATVQLVEHVFESSTEALSDGVERRLTSLGEVVHLVRPERLVRRVESEMQGPA